VTVLRRAAASVVVVLVLAAGAIETFEPRGYFALRPIASQKRAS